LHIVRVADGRAGFIVQQINQLACVPSICGNPSTEGTNPDTPDSGDRACGTNARTGPPKVVVIS
ncbi:MAG: hypothetical protein RLZZ401_2411, partial [Pseudomonadota bacterium]|jgi:hypothetical protein